LRKQARHATWSAGNLAAEVPLVQQRAWPVGRRPQNSAPASQFADPKKQQPAVGTAGQFDVGPMAAKMSSGVAGGAPICRTASALSARSRTTTPRYHRSDGVASCIPGMLPLHGAACPVPPGLCEFSTSSPGEATTLSLCDSRRVIRSAASTATAQSWARSSSL